MRPMLVYLLKLRNGVFFDNPFQDKTELVSKPKTLVSNPEFSLFPNPAEDFIQLKVEIPILKTTLSDGLGVTYPMNLSNQKDRLELSGMKPGVH
jgi:hypothetical protein